MTFLTGCTEVKLKKHFTYSRVCHRNSSGNECVYFPHYTNSKNGSYLYILTCLGIVAVFPMSLMRYK